MIFHIFGLFNIIYDLNLIYGEIMKNLFIFDMDGLLLDTEALYQKYWFQVIKEKNINMTELELRKIIGFSFDQTKNYFLNYVNNEEEFYELRKRREVIFWEEIEKYGVPTKLGVIEMLEHLKQENIKTALITSTEEQRAKKLLKYAGINHEFDYMVFSNMVSKTKPDPEVYHLLESFTDINKDEWIVFEDSYNGLKAANNANVDVVWIKDLAELKDHNVNYKNRYESLLDCLYKIKNSESL